MIMSKINFDRKLFNPNFYHALKYLSDPSLRYCFFYGGSSSSKTYSIVQAILLTTLQDGKNSLIFRKVSASIKKTIYNDFQQVINRLQLNNYFTVQNFGIKCVNGAKIDFMGLDNPEKVKGISTYLRIMFDEITEGELEDFKQLRKRMRGIENQKLICTFNPIDESHWLKKDIYDQLDLENQPTTLNNNPLTTVTDVKRCKNYIWIRSTYLNNYWIIGAPNNESWGFIDKNTIDDFENDKLLDINFYNIYALGLWGKLTNGTEYYKLFKREKHVKSNIKPNPELPLHISFDENVRPYLPLTVTQIEEDDDDRRIVVIDEIIGESPNNNITSVVKIFAEKYKNYKSNKIFLYGDATSRRNDARTEQGYNLFGIIVSQLESLGFTDITVKVNLSNPSVIQSGQFMNKLLAGLLPYTLVINENCINTISDFQYLKEDKDGGILKQIVKDKSNGTTYEKYGHCSDSVRYLIIKYLEDEYNKSISKVSNVEIFDITFDDDIMAF